MPLYTVEQLSGRRIEEGPMLFAVAVGAANILKDVREHITNTFGGRMSRYEDLAQATLARALADLDTKAKDGGYDGVVGVRIDHPKIADGAASVVVYGTPFRYVSNAS
jgi:uncharacterized protein YbjQ (UPF0145 family)